MTSIPGETSGIASQLGPAGGVNRITVEPSSKVAIHSPRWTLAGGDQVRVAATLRLVRNSGASGNVMFFGTNANDFNGSNYTINLDGGNSMNSVTIGGTNTVITFIGTANTHLSAASTWSKLTSFSGLCG